LGMTIQVRGVDYVKPSVWAECDFDSIPTDKEIQDKFAWMWTTQIAPQAEQMLDLMTSTVKKVVGEFDKK